MHISFRLYHTPRFDSAPSVKEYQEHFPEGKGGQVREADKLTTFVCRMSWNLGTYNSWKLLAHKGPVTGLLYLYLYFILTPVYTSLSSLRNRNDSHKRCREIQNKFSYSKTVLRISCLVRHNVEKFCTSREASEDIMAHAHCKLYNLGYKYNLSLCNIHGFSTANIFARTHTNTSTYWGSSDEESSANTMSILR